jgi:hypothetical protein
MSPETPESRERGWKTMAEEAAEMLTLSVDANKLAEAMLAYSERKAEGQFQSIFGEPEDALETAIECVNALVTVIIEMLGEENVGRVIELQEELVTSREQADF